MSDSIDLTVNAALFESGEPAVTLTIQGPMFELNIWMRPDELPMLKRVSTADWNQRGSVRIGRAGSSAVFWSADQEHLSILVGHDDETWDFGVMLPLHVLAEIVAEVNAEQAVAADRPKMGAG